MGLSHSIQVKAASVIQEIDKQSALASINVRKQLLAIISYSLDGQVAVLKSISKAYHALSEYKDLYQIPAESLGDIALDFNKVIIDLTDNFMDRVAHSQINLRDYAKSQSLVFSRAAFKPPTASICSEKGSLRFGLHGYSQSISSSTDIQMDRFKQDRSKNVPSIALPQKISTQSEIFEESSPLPINMRRVSEIGETEEESLHSDRRFSSINYRSKLKSVRTGRRSSMGTMQINDIMKELLGNDEAGEQRANRISHISLTPSEAELEKCAPSDNLCLSSGRLAAT